MNYRCGCQLECDTHQPPCSQPQPYGWGERICRCSKPDALRRADQAGWFRTCPALCIIADQHETGPGGHSVCKQAGLGQMISEGTVTAVCIRSRAVWMARCRARDGCVRLSEAFTCTGRFPGMVGSSMPGSGPPERYTAPQARNAVVGAEHPTLMTGAARQIWIMVPVLNSGQKPLCSCPATGQVYEFDTNQRRSAARLTRRPDQPSTVTCSKVRCRLDPGFSSAYSPCVPMVGGD